ncbi:hypothetical protein PFISCL1PPCAC_12772 [Pristionchus fissidentatus]|uniref:Myotubularin phosphatase domain-containing protein n=1 Tax=Pristionchus fissidentatus TaxID=1538716 RepID=A0AAV5VSC1_9BILA|nr:hypothetical protein PFISCL1PPCAC_12772 [Pristionchus fissidentatus]
MLWQAASIWDRLHRLGEESYRLMHASDPVDVPGQSPNDTSNLSTSPPMESFCAVSPPSFYIPTKSDDIDLAPVKGEKLEEATEFLSSRVYVTNYRLVIMYDRSSRG